LNLVIKEPTLITSIKDKEILLSVKTLLSIYEKTCPLMRDFGIDINFISQNIDVVKEYYIQELFDKLEKYVPEIKVISISFEDTSISELKAIIHFEKRGNNNEFDI